MPDEGRYARSEPYRDWLVALGYAVELVGFHAVAAASGRAAAVISRSI